jgi:hypothetical protein
MTRRAQGIAMDVLPDKTPEERVSLWCVNKTVGLKKKELGILITP